MYVAPNSVIKLLTGVPLDDRYTDTVLFTDKSTQATTFMGYTKHNLTAQSYQRVHKGKCRVQLPFNDVYDCNYMMFQNTSFGTKWWYAFITKCEYVNNTTTEIEYKLDFMQNWCCDWSFNPTYIARTHVGNDNIGANIVPEDFSGGERFNCQYDPMPMDNGSTVRYYVFATFGDSDYPAGASEFNYHQGYAQGLTIFEFTEAQATAGTLRDWLNDVTTANLQDGIVGIFPFYAYYAGTDLDDTAPLKPSEHEWDMASLESLNGYVPRNNKLWTYPYNAIKLVNSNGDTSIYRYEFFEDLEVKFMVRGLLAPPPSLLCTPLNYNGGGDYSVFSYLDNSHAMCVRDFPQVGYAIDGFRAWLAQNFIPTTVALAGLALGGIQGAAAVEATNIAGMTRANNQAQLALELSDAYSKYPTVDKQGNFTNNYARNLDMMNVRASHAGEDFVPQEYHNKELANYISSEMGTVVQATHQAPQSIAGGSSILFACSRLKFQLFQECIPNNIAKTIDEYFDRFGYAIKQIQTPNLNARPYYTYIKTVGMKINGNIPNDDCNKIEATFDTGITFWNNIANVGNYSQAIREGNAI